MRYFIFMIIALACTLSFGEADAKPKNAFHHTMEDAMLEAIAEKLHDRGYLASTKNYSDASFEAAVRAYQKDANNHVTGIADQSLINHLNFGPKIRAKHNASKAYNKPVSDPYVKWAQEALKDLNIYQGAIDGLQGPKTKEAILRYEAKNDLPMTGKVTPDLLKHLENISEPDPVLEDAMAESISKAASEVVSEANEIETTPTEEKVSEDVTAEEPEYDAKGRPVEKNTELPSAQKEEDDVLEQKIPDSIPNAPEPFLPAR